MNADKDIRPGTGTHIDAGLQFILTGSIRSVHIFIGGTGQGDLSSCRNQICLHIFGNEKRRVFFFMSFQPDRTGVCAAMAGIDGDPLPCDPPPGSEIDSGAYRWNANAGRLNLRTAHRSSAIFQGRIVRLVRDQIHYNTRRSARSIVFSQDKAFGVRPLNRPGHRHTDHYSILRPLYIHNFRQVAFNRALAKHLITQTAIDFDLQFFRLHVHIIAGGFRQIHHKTQHIILIYAPVHIGNSGRC